MGLIGHFFSERQKKSEFCNLQLNAFSHRDQNAIITQQSILVLYAIQSIVSSTNCLRLLPGAAQSDRFFPLSVDKYSIKPRSIVCRSDLNFLETAECMFSV